LFLLIYGGDKESNHTIYNELPFYSIRLGHIEKSCDESKWRLRDKPFGEWLHVVPARRRI
jgi:hypothetical protein